MRGTKIQIPRASVLTPEQEQEIHEAAMKILKNTGVKVCDPGTRELLLKQGCRVEGEAVFMDEAFIMEALEKHPHTFTIRALERKNDCCISNDTFVVTPAPGTRSVDTESWEPQMPSRKDFYDYMRLIDMLDEVDMHTAFPWAGFAGVPDCMSLLENVAAKLRTGSKAIWEGSVRDNYKYLIRIAKELDIDVWVNTNPTSPLTFFKENLQAMRALSEADMVYSITSGPLPGVSSPVTIAGAVALNIADILAGNAIAQTYRAGTRVIAGAMILAVNMRTGVPLFANATSHLAESAMVQMCRRYGLPIATNSVGWSNSKMLDYQAAYETTAALTTMVWSGTSIAPFVGGLCSELTAHPLKAVIDNDIVKLLRRVQEGITLDEEHLALDLIESVGFAPSSYLAEEHTVEFYQEEQSQSRVADNSAINDWIKAGKPTILDHARTEMERLLKKSGYVLEPEKECILEKILEEARHKYREQGLIDDREWENYRQSIQASAYPFA